MFRICVKEHVRANGHERIEKFYTREKNKTLLLKQNNSKSAILGEAALNLESSLGEERFSAKDQGRI